MVFASAQVPAGAAGAEARPGTPAPQARLNTTQWDFGTVWYGEPCSSTIELTNAGTAVLTIKNVLTTCGCTVARPTENTLAPGRSTTIALSYNTKKGVTAVSQSVTVETDDPINPRLHVMVKGKVRPLFEMRMNGNPVQQVNIGQITPETEVTYRIEMENRYDRPVTLKLREAPSDAPFVAKLEEIEAGKKYRLTASTRPPMKTGTQTLLALLDTDLPSAATLEQTITAYVMERVSATPERLYYAADAPPPARRTIRLNWLREKPARIVSIRALPETIQVDAPQSPGPEAFMGLFGYDTFNLVLPPWNDFPAEGGSVEIVTNDPDPRFQKVIVPIIKFDPKSPAAAGAPEVRAVPLPAGAAATQPAAAAPPAQPKP